MPVGFAADQLEVLYDVDIEARQRAEALQIRLERPPSLNEDPLFIKTLEDAVVERALEAGFIGKVTEP
jgi:ferrochelatase